MESHEAIICRFCLKICQEFKSIEGYIKEVLEIVLRKIDLAVVDEPVICTNCLEVLLNCFDFKTACFNTHDYIVPFIHHEKNIVKLDLLDVYLSKNENGTALPDGQDICASCMSPVNNCSSISLDVEERDATLDNMMEQCVPELDLSIIRKAVICPSCHASLENYFHFVTNSLIVEEKIKKYCETLDVNSIGQAELGHMRYLKSEPDGNLVDKIKVETQFCEERENDDEGEIANRHDTSKLERSSGNDTKNVTGEVVDKHKSYLDDVDDLKFNNEEQFAPKTILNYKESCNNVDIKVEMFCGENGLKEESSIEMEDHNRCLLNEDIEIKTDEQDFNRFQEPEVTTKSHSEQKSFKPNLKGDLLTPYIKQKLVNKRSSAVVIMYQCGGCSYQTKYKSNLTTHVLIHKDLSEVTMYKCDSCSFQTRVKGNLKMHVLVHMNSSEITMHKCDSCSFQTKRKDSLKKHMLVHKNSLEITMFKCDYCSFRAKRKYHLKSHLLIHKIPSDVTMYKCDSCSFETKRKNSLKRHVIIHMYPSGIAMYKCDSCSFQTKYKDGLKEHVLVHKNHSDITVYKCDSCSYQTKVKRNFKSHVLVHKNPSEVTMFKCDSCSFQVKRKGHLKRHLLIHKIPSEVTMYKCDSCSYQTRHKGVLKEHVLMHENPSQITKYKCGCCSFQTKRKCSLKRHVMVHKNSSEIT